ncbi:MAG: GNAT family N-acetyltransferase [Paracoccaceae bacterium]|nr:GNAT family N-acetyltransferase [Paracoccaceae bacterium]
MQHRLDTASPQLVPQIVAIWHAGWHATHAALVPEELTRRRTPEEFLQRAKANLADTRVAVLGGDVMGFCMVRRDELYQMYVANLARGTGVAQTLIADAEGRMLENGHHTAWLDCAIGNDRAVRFYEKTGWQNKGRRTTQLDTSTGPFALEVLRFEKPLGLKIA